MSYSWYMQPVYMKVTYILYTWRPKQVQIRGLSTSDVAGWHPCCQFISRMCDTWCQSTRNSHTHVYRQTDRQTDRQTCVIYSLNVCRATYSWSKFMQTAWQVVRAVWVELFILLEFSIEYLIEYWVPTDTGCDELNVNGKWQPITEMSYRKSRSLNSMAMSEFV